MKLRNTGDNDLVGYFSPNIVSNLSVYYRRSGEDFTEYTCNRQNQPHSFIVIPRILKPQQETEKEEILNYDTKRDQFVLNKPGTYEFKAIYWDSPGAANARIESNTIIVKVLPVPENDNEAFNIYNHKGIALLIQQDSWGSDVNIKDVLQRSALLIERYPSSLYTVHVQEQFIPWLKRRISANIASEQEKEIYQLVKEKIPNVE